MLKRSQLQKNPIKWENLPSIFYKSWVLDEKENKWKFQLHEILTEETVRRISLSLQAKGSGRVSGTGGGGGGREGLKCYQSQTSASVSSSSLTDFFGNCAWLFACFILLKSGAVVLQVCEARAVHRRCRGEAWLPVVLTGLRCRKVSGAAVLPLLPDSEVHRFEVISCLCFIYRVIYKVPILLPKYS